MYLERRYEEAIIAQISAREHSKVRYDAQHRPRSYNINDKVLIKARDRKAKLDPKYIGPYRVIEANKDGFKLEHLENKKVVKRHTAQIKQYTSVNAISVARSRQQAPQVTDTVDSVNKECIKVSKVSAQSDKPQYHSQPNSTQWINHRRAAKLTNTQHKQQTPYRSISVNGKYCAPQRVPLKAVIKELLIKILITMLISNVTGQHYFDTR